MSIVYINGCFCDSKEATVSIFDRGFLFGDSVYEVLPVYNGVPVFLDRHLVRLESNLNKIKIITPKIEWREVITDLIQNNPADNLQVYIQITRGNQGARKHDIPTQITPTIIAYTLETPYPTFESKSKGLTAKLLEDIRWTRCDIKTTSLLGNILLNDEAVSAGYHTSVLVRDGFITEGSTSNVFIVSKSNVVKTPPLNQLCLPGITRQITIDLIKGHSWSFSEEPVSVTELFDAEEVWITSTTKEIFPVTQINDSSIGQGHGGAYWKTIEKSFQNLIRNQL